MGFWELCVIALVALIVLGPERLPSVARSAGRIMANLRRVKDDFTAELDEQSLQLQLEKNINKAKLAEQEQHHDTTTKK